MEGISFDLGTRGQWIDTYSEHESCHPVVDEYEFLEFEGEAEMCCCHDVSSVYVHLNR